MLQDLGNVEADDFYWFYLYHIKYDFFDILILGFEF